MTRHRWRATFSSYALAHAWLNAWVAVEHDDYRPVIDRALLVEAFPHGVQLIGMDGAVLLGTFAPDERNDLRPPPSLDEAPTGRWVVMDHDKRAAGLMKHLMRTAKAAIKDGLLPEPVTVSVISAESPTTPTLGAELDRLDFIIEADRERLALPIYDGEPINWRRLVAAHHPAPTDELFLTPWVLAKLGALRDFPGAVQLVTSGPNGALEIRSAAECYLFGLVTQAGDGNR